MNKDGPYKPDLMILHGLCCFRRCLQLPSDSLESANRMSSVCIAEATIGQYLVVYYWELMLFECRIRVLKVFFVATSGRRRLSARPARPCYASLSQQCEGVRETYVSVRIRLYNHVIRFYICLLCGEATEQSP